MIKNFFLLSIFFTFSCQIIDVKDLDIDCNPATRDQVLLEGEEIVLDFNYKLKKLETENLITIKTFFNEDKIAVDYFWRTDKQLVIMPQVPLSKGIKYLLSINGSFETIDGDSYTRTKDITFYYISSESYCKLINYTPENSADLGVFESLSYTFSESLEQGDFEEHFKITPSIELTYLWNDTNTKVTVSPKDKWAQQTIYTWEINSNITQNINSNLVKKYEGTFIVQQDQEFPELVEILEGRYNSGIFTEMTTGLNALTNRSSIKFNFNKKLDPESFIGSLKITPDIQGTIESIDDKSWLFIPSEDWIQGTEYNLTISEDLKDNSDNSMRNKINLYFKPWISPVSILSVTVIDSTPPPGINQQTINSIDLNKSVEYNILPDTTNGSIQVILKLEQGNYNSSDERNRFINSISFDSLFPKMTSAQLAQVRWTNSNEVLLFFFGISLPTGTTFFDKQSYQLKIKGGQQYKNDLGGFLEEDTYVNFNILS